MLPHSKLIGEGGCRLMRGVQRKEGSRGEVHKEICHQIPWDWTRYQSMQASNRIGEMVVKIHMLVGETRIDKEPIGEVYLAKVPTSGWLCHIIDRQITLPQVYRAAFIGCMWPRWHRLISARKSITRQSKLFQSIT